MADPCSLQCLAVIGPSGLRDAVIRGVRVARCKPRGRAPRFQPGRAPGTRDALPPLMLDVLLVAAAAAFFALCWGYVRFCERLGGAP